MRKEKIHTLCCPIDKNDLILKTFREENGEILEGLLVCEECKRYFPIISGIPIMTPNEFRQAEFELPFLEKWKSELPALRTDFKIDFQGKADYLLKL